MKLGRLNEGRHPGAGRGPELQRRKLDSGLRRNDEEVK